MSRRRRKAKPPKRSALKSEINVTPLVDVVLVLLIIFMVVTPLLGRGAKVELPRTVHHESENDNGKDLIVSLTKERKIFVEADEVTKEEAVRALKTAIEDARKKGSTGVVWLKADRALPYAPVRELLEMIHQAGSASVALST